MASSLCLFPGLSDALEKSGIRSYRIFGLSAVDLILTILTAFLILKWKYPLGKSAREQILIFLIILAILMVISVVVHLVFCVPTTLTELLLE